MHVLTLHLRRRLTGTRNHGASTLSVGFITGELAVFSECTVLWTDCTEMKFRLPLFQGLSLALWSAPKALGHSPDDESGDYVLPEGSRMNYVCFHTGYY